MSRRIEIELTSQRPDGSWTWRAAGAREPKGELANELLGFPASVGDELTVEADFHMDGIEIIEAFAHKEKRPMPETLEILGSGRDQPLVTTQLVSGGKGRDRDRGDRRGRDRGDRRDGRDRGDRRDGRDRGDRREFRREDDQPKAKRLRPGRTHRQALIDSLPEEQKPVAEKIMRDGVASVEQALRDQRKKARDEAQARREAAKQAAEAQAEDQTVQEEAETKAAEAQAEDQTVPVEAAKEAAEPVPAQAEELDKAAKEQAPAPEKATTPKTEEPDSFLRAAAKLLSRMQAAEWRDRVEAALAGMDEIDLRDLRSVVVAAETGATDDEAKALAEELRTKLSERVDREHAEWLAEVAATLADGRMVRALRLSSRPPKAGVPLPQDMVTRLTEAANAALTSETPTKRWATVLGAVAFSPVRRTVQPQGIPEKPDQELLGEVTKLSQRVPHIAALFGVEPTPPPKRPRRGGNPRAAQR
ncbi:hypothetical protein [Candidatus Poriferisocius sp.]|uniref:hypothetical protein n=1 Tax=Candidatus Poriferisocius sp. TaxID=3101276 RepID=UPI003B5A467C